MGDNEISADVSHRPDTRTSTVASKRFLFIKGSKIKGSKNLLLTTTILFINLSQKLAIFAIEVCKWSRSTTHDITQ